MRSVFVAFDPPMPPTGGGTRSYQMLKTLSQISSCHLFICFQISPDQLPEDVKKACKKIDIAQHSFTPAVGIYLIRLFDQLRMAFLPFTFSAADVVLKADYFLQNTPKYKNVLKKWLYNKICLSLLKESKRRYSSGFQMPARTLERIQQYIELEKRLLAILDSADILWIDFSYPLAFFSKIKSKFPELRIICNAHNIEYLYYERLAEAAVNNLQKEWLYLQATLMKKVEVEGFIQCDDVLVCSEADKVTLQKELPNLKVSVVPNGVDINYFQPHHVEPNVPTLLFTGTMTYAPNQDAVNYFISDIFPKVKKELPACVFVVAGSNASMVFSKYEFRTDIKIVDSPADMRLHYNYANLVVVPLRSGSGTRLKILEALAMGKPIISTVLGAEGIDAENGTHLIVTSSETDFANMIIFLLKNRNNANKISSSAIEFVRRNYDWKNITYHLKKILLEEYP